MTLYEFMPVDWDDHVGWDRYYTKLHEAGKYPPPNWKANLEIFEASQLAKRFDTAIKQRVWVAGCGVSLIPHMLAFLGFDVVATDASAVAISQQQIMQKRLNLADAIADEFDLTIHHQGHATYVQHDFRTEPPLTDADWVVNARAFQVLSSESMLAAARTHYGGLRDGGQAVFVTTNLTGERAQQVEDAITLAGFMLEGSASVKWLRDQLLATGIPHVFIRDRTPTVLHQHEYYENSDSASVEADRATVNELFTLFEMRKVGEDAEQKARATANPAIKRAHLVIVTG